MCQYDYVPDICYDPNTEKQGFLDLYLPKNKPNCSAVLFFHGGGLESGDRTCDQAIYQYLANHGIAVVAADYRIYPTAKFPEFIEDAAKAANWFYNNRNQYGFNNLYIVGSSAVSYLAMMLFSNSEYLSAQGRRFTDFQGFFFNAGQPTVHYNVLRERGADTRLVRLDDAAPLYHITQEYNNIPQLPKLQWIVADDDMPGRLEQNLLFKRTLIHFGYPEEKMGFKIMEGYTHCGYDGEFKNGASVLGDLILQFVNP